MIQLSHNFMAELFKLMFIDINIMRMVSGHLTYQLIPKEWIGYKFLLRESVEQFNKKDCLPSLGVIAQKFATNESVQETIDEIKEAQIVDKELIVDQLEAFIKETEFEILSKKVHDLYNEGKRSEAIKLNADESKRILEISLRKTGGNFVRVFADFKERMRSKRSESLTRKVQKKLSFGIDRLDDISYGGADPGDTILWIMRSGVGKSISLRWQGYCAALEGEPVLHIQLEGGADACTDKYDQIWTNQPYVEIKKGSIKAEDVSQIEKTLDAMQNFGQDIDIYGFKKFGEASVLEVRNLILEYFKIHGFFPRLLVLDSLDLLKTGLNKKLDEDPDYTKQRLQTCAQRLKDIAVEFNLVVVTATQTGHVPIEIWNSEDRVIDRNYTEGDRTLVKPFSFVFTGNITIREKELNRCRVFIDKLRDYKDSQQIFTIATDYDRGRFYSKSKTLSLNIEPTTPVEVKTKERKSRTSKSGIKATEI